MATLAPRLTGRAPATQDGRRARRHSVEMTRAGLRLATEAPWEVTLVDLSTFGCRVSGDHQAETGDRVSLRIAGGAAGAATVMWREDEVLGCRFDAPIERTLMRKLVLGI